MLKKCPIISRDGLLINMLDRLKLSLHSQSDPVNSKSFIGLLFLKQSVINEFPVPLSISFLTQISLHIQILLLSTILLVPIKLELITRTLTLSGMAALTYSVLFHIQFQNYVKIYSLYILNIFKIYSSYILYILI